MQDRAPALPSIPPEVLGTLRTLRSIIEIISDPLPAPSGLTPADAPRREPVASPTDEIARVLVETVADKTGYPAEMLELNMRLTADLGIDSIKRVEIFSSLQDQLPGAPVAGPEEIGTLETLGDVVSFLGRTVAKDAGSAVPAVGGGLRQVPAAAPVAQVTLESAAGEMGADFKHANGAAGLSAVELRRLYPRAQALELPDRRDEIAPREGATVWITDDSSPLAQALERRITERGLTAKLIRLDEVRAPATAERLCGLIVLAPERSADHRLISSAFRLIKAAAGALEESAAHGGASLLTVSRLDGSFGLSGLSSRSCPVSGALAGLAKTALCEWPLVNCKAIDVDAAFDAPDGASRVIVEEFFKRGPSEVGLSRQGRTIIELEAEPAAARPPRRGGGVLAPGDVVIASGGARGITAEVAVALASAFQPRLVLLGRSPAPMPEPSWLALIDDLAGLRRALSARSDRRLTPHELAEESNRVLVEREIRRNLERIKSAGSQAVYHSVDVRDVGAVRAWFRACSENTGRFAG